MKLNWTDEQLAIFDAVKASEENLMIEALAGAAKTSTLVELAKHLRGGTIAIAFNKKIADEMKERMPANVECRTLNALGHRIWQQKLGKKMTLSDSKLHKILMDKIEFSLPDDKDHLYETLGDLRNILQGSKNHGHVPDSIAEEIGDRCTPLLSDEEFFDMLPEEVSPVQREVVLAVLRQSFTMALAGTIDFADQLLLPTVMRCMFPTFQNVLVDEAQDLSELNHIMLAKLAKRRIIAVGDSKQAIYAFRGAHHEGMPLLASRFKMATLNLSTTFRCPEAICQHVRWHVPNINSWEGNPNNPGEVVPAANGWTMDEIPDGSAVICRNNAPLFRMAIRMLKAGRRPQVWGRDIAASLLKIMEGLGAINMKQADANASLNRYKAEKLRKIKKESAKAALDERVECIRIFLNDAESLGGAIALAKNVFNSVGKVDLCSGHKSKGHEWDNVFFLDRDLLDDEGQDLNLRYVIATRAKARLTYIETGGYVE